MFSFLNVQTLHNEYSYIEHLHRLFCAHLINIFLGLLNLDIYPSEMLTGWLVCVICDSSSFIPSYSNLICYDCSHIENVCKLYFVHI